MFKPMILRRPALIYRLMFFNCCKICYFSFSVVVEEVGSHSQHTLLYNNCWNSQGEEKILISVRLVQKVYINGCVKY